MFYAFAEAMLYTRTAEQTDLGCAGVRTVHDAQRICGSNACRTCTAVRLQGASCCPHSSGQIWWCQDCASKKSAHVIQTPAFHSTRGVPVWLAREQTFVRSQKDVPLDCSVTSTKFKANLVANTKSRHGRGRRGLLAARRSAVFGVVCTLSPRGADECFLPP